MFLVSMPYISLFSTKIDRILGKIGIKMAHRSKITIRNRLPKSKDKIHRLGKSDVYKISCVSCGSSYVDQRGRRIRTRLKERFNGKDSQMRMHVLAEDHDQQTVDVKIIHVVSKGKKMDNLERI